MRKKTIVQVMILLKGEQLILLNLVVGVSTWTNFFCLKSRD